MKCRWRGPKQAAVVGALSMFLMTSFTSQKMLLRTVWYPRKRIPHPFLNLQLQSLPQSMHKGCLG